MITVDIFVPYLNISYDFSLDEMAPIQTVIERVTTLICLKERRALPTTPGQLMLFDPSSQKSLGAYSSLCSAGILSGQRLILC